MRDEEVFRVLSTSQFLTQTTLVMGIEQELVLDQSEFHQLSYLEILGHILILHSAEDYLYIQTKI